MPDEYGINDPEWLPFNADGSMNFGHAEQGHPGVLTIHGITDLLHHLTEEAEEEVREWLSHGGRDEGIPDWLRAVLPVKPPPVDVLAEISPAYHWRATSYVVPVGGNPTLLSSRGDRLRAVITNQGAANPAYLSWTDDATVFNSAGEMEWVALPNGNLPGNPRELRSGGKIWVYSPLGTEVDIQEEYGSRFYRTGYQSP